MWNKMQTSQLSTSNEGDKIFQSALKGFNHNLNIWVYTLILVHNICTK
jgi:hypothetical protein